MHILHIAHYDMLKHPKENFLIHITNGLERFLSTVITYDTVDRHFVLMFEESIGRISISEPLVDGSFGMFTTYKFDIENASSLYKIISELQEKLSISIVHFHYQNNIVLDIPDAVKQLNLHLMATIHDESYIASEFGLVQNYTRREEVANFLNEMSYVVFPHLVIQQRYEALYPEIKINSLIIANGVTLPKCAKLNHERNLKVLFLGGLNKYKGAEIVSEVTLSATDTMEFHLLGMIEGTGAFASISPFSSHNLLEKVSEINPDVIVIPSIVQESFSYTAAEATAMGYPVVTFAVGALAAIEEEHRGYVATEITAAGLLAKLQQLLDIKNNNPVHWKQIFEQIQQVHMLSEEEMEQKYKILYNSFAIRGTGLVDKHYFEQKSYEIMRDNLQELKDNKEKEIILQLALEDVVESVELANQDKASLMQTIAYLRQHPFKTFIVTVLTKLGVKKID